GDAATRDVQTGMEPLVRATPLSAGQYVSSRFAGAVAVAAILLLVIPLVLGVVGVLHPGVEAAALGPFRVVAHLQSYLLLILPNAVVTTALMFSLAMLLRHTLGSCVGAAAVVAGMQVCLLYLGGMRGEWRLASMLDPTGVTAITVMLQTLAPAEMNQRAAALA